MNRKVKRKVKRKGIRKFFSKPKKGFRTYGSGKGWRCMRPQHELSQGSNGQDEMTSSDYDSSKKSNLQTLQCNVVEVEDVMLDTVPKRLSWNGLMNVESTNKVNTSRTPDVIVNESQEECSFAGFDAESIKISEMSACCMKCILLADLPPITVPNESPASPQGSDGCTVKPRIRVLSLFDGISSGYLVLSEKLNLDIDEYFSSEVDKDAIQVQRKNLNGKVTELGCVTSIDFEKLRSLGPINLLLGGSPCDQLSRVNPRRKGLYDLEASGHLFFYFVSIKKFLEKESIKNNTPFAWLFENTANMDKQNLLDISLYLECTPKILCSSLFSPMKRKRCYWGTLESLDDSHEVPSYNPTYLQEYLDPLRKAKVSILPTITTNASSQRQGKCKDLPIEENGEDCQLTINEKEKIFGFPSSYTDAGNISITRRGKLVGKSWSLPVITFLLKPLADTYKLKE